MPDNKTPKYQYDHYDFGDMLDSAVEAGSKIGSSVLGSIADALEQAGLSERIKQEPNGILTQMTKAVSGNGISLSGGEAQKLLMARMLYHKSAQIWILDEPTAALDAIAESEVYEKFRELGKEKTCIYISHRLASTQFMDRIILLKDGKIQESGTHKELMAQNRMYARLYEIQSRYYREEEQQ